jgi:D-sedoheptulose 7-phosphate isomerase
MENFKDKINQSINESIAVKSKLLDLCSNDIEKCGFALANAIKNGGKIMFCGNGGSAADSQHLAAELVVRLRSHINRPALPGLALTVDSSIMTAGGNDIGFENVFARSVEAFGKAGDVLIGISTSGNSGNVLNAMKKANEMNIHNICLLGNGGGKMLELADLSVVVPSNITARVQECHILVGHIWCEMIEEILFPEFF